MTQLECIYLMNVALYLRVEDIPTFIRINNKAKDAIEGLHINPIDTGNYQTRENELKIIHKSFPKLETLQIQYNTLYKILTEPEKYSYLFNEKIQFIRTNDFPHKSIEDYFEKNDIPQEPMSVMKENKMTERERDQLLERLYTSMNRLKYLFSSYNPLKDVDYDVLSGYIEHFTIHMNDIEHFIQHYQGHQIYKKFKTITILYDFSYGINLSVIIRNLNYLKMFCNYIIVSVNDFDVKWFAHICLRYADEFPDFVHVRFPSIFGKQFQMSISFMNEYLYKDFRKMLREYNYEYDDVAIPSKEYLFKKIDEHFQPYQFELTNFPDSLEQSSLMWFSSPQKIITVNCHTEKEKEERIFNLPESTEIIKVGYGPCKQFINNWNELNHIKRIEHNNYDINVPLKYVDCLVNVKENKDVEKKKNTLHKSIFFTNIIFIIMTFFSMIVNGSNNYEKHYKFCFPIMCCQIILHGILKSFRSIQLFYVKRKRFKNECYYDIVKKIITYLIPIYINKSATYCCLYFTYIFKRIYLLINSDKHDITKEYLILKRSLKSFLFKIPYQVHISFLIVSKILQFIGLFISLSTNIVVNIIVCFIYTFIIPWFDISDIRWQDEEFNHFKFPW